MPTLPTLPTLTPGHRFKLRPPAPRPTLLLAAWLAGLGAIGWAPVAWAAVVPAIAPAIAVAGAGPGADTVPVPAPPEPVGLQVQTAPPWRVLAVHGLAARAGVHVGDHVLAVNGQLLNRADQLPMSLSRDSPSAALLVEREGREIFIPLHLP
jgi:serine protease Do